MSKRILLIDSDEAFAQGLSDAIKARGFVASMATNSEQGMSMAKQDAPDLIVVCVEAQPTNGYMLCTRLKKDDQLKSIPVILTSAHATADSFEKHKKLKTRAEEYLIKPFEAEMMLEKASALMGVQLPPEQIGEDEIVAVEDEPLGLGALVEGEDEPISLSEADAVEARSGQPEEAVLVEEVDDVMQIEEEKAPNGEDDLEMFDKAFDSLGGPAMQAAPQQTTRFGNSELAASLEDEPAKEPTELSAPDDDAVLSTLEDEASDAQALIADLEEKLAEPEPAKARRSSAPMPRESPNKPDKEALRLKREVSALEAEVEQLKEEAARREAAVKTHKERADALAATAKKFERELSAAREEARKGSKAAELERELEELRSEAQALTGEKDLLAEERDELKRQLEEAQAAAAQNEDRAVKAYQKIKGDEKLREKTRKALQIALQLLEDSSADSDEEPASSKKFA